MYIVIYKAGEYSLEKARRKEEAGKKIREWVNSMTVLLKGYDNHTTQQRKRRLLAEEKKRPAQWQLKQGAHKNIPSTL